MIWDSVPYLSAHKRKNAAFSKFSVIFGEEKSTFTLSWLITTAFFSKRLMR